MLTKDKAGRTQWSKATLADLRDELRFARHETGDYRSKEARYYFKIKSEIKKREHPGYQPTKPAKPAKPATRKPAEKKTGNKEPKRESMTMGVRRSRESPYHSPPQYIEHWEAAVAQAHGNMARPKRELPVLKSELKHFQRLAKEYPDNDYYPVAIASNRRQIAVHLDRIRAEQDQLRYLARHKPTAYLDKARYMREKRAREKRYK